MTLHTSSRIVIALGVLASLIFSTSCDGNDNFVVSWRNLSDTSDLRVRGAERKPQVAPRCPETPKPRVVEIREADPKIDKQHHDMMRGELINAIFVPNTTVLLGPKVILDFTTAKDEELPLVFGPCVTLMSVNAFLPFTDVIGQSARTPSSLGPLLKFGPHRRSNKRVFLEITCLPNDIPNDGVRISGFRLHGPSFGQQSHDDIGIFIRRCLDIEISNMEIAGWGGQGIHVEDDPGGGPGQERPANNPGERIGRPDQIRIFRNYIHHNQHPRGLFFGSALGYGVEVSDGAWAQIYENVFDFNRHAIAADGGAGGYEARRNLVLKGGGLHFSSFLFNIYTHQFDIHGSGGKGFGRQASFRDWFSHNSFQYLNGPAIEIRGRPHLEINIDDNIFAHEGLEDDPGADAIHVFNRHDLDVIKIGPGNTTDFRSFGQYGVCDFDGDRIDDLFLATGRTWWYSSFAEFHWTYLSARNERLNQVRLGYFDDDLRCDVLTESNGQWLISSGGTSDWTSIGSFGVPLSQVAFGQFDPNFRDHRPGVTRRTTHAFQRAANGEWLVTTLSAPDWKHAQSLSLPMNKLRFGDFTGDGVTDVLAVQAGRWAISESARKPWRRLNQHLSDDVSRLFFADLNNNNIDDIIRLEVLRTRLGPGVSRDTASWWVSDDGRSRWRKLKSYTYFNIGFPVFGFAGRFGRAPGGGVLFVDPIRRGRFFSEAEVATGARANWTSLYAF